MRSQLIAALVVVVLAAPPAWGGVEAVPTAQAISPEIQLTKKGQVYLSGLDADLRCRPGQRGTYLGVVMTLHKAGLTIRAKAVTFGGRYLELDEATMWEGRRKMVGVLYGCTVRIR